MIIEDLGLLSHARADEIQFARLEQVALGGPVACFLMELEPVVTLGRFRGRENLLISEQALAERGIALVQTCRGGDVTCHFPGQVVAYPIIRVAGRKGGIRGVFNDMEQAMISALASFNIKGEQDSARPGVWVRGRKIGSVGIGVKRGVSCHGLSLNLGRDLSLFDLITPCGLQGVQVTSLLREAGDRESEASIMAEMKHVLGKELATRLG